ncbi:MAG: bifunctional 5,10-methylenetetrahydrofolate dehydrogenase/5,10-methenyltetrahydrofolate cyclohydrolase [Bacteroidales bacterium]|jgi:methylenetetrahydrofolate dehydrogenase (NADP+)/methenyltetrahydrofolate cyclohydrolase|nr:bifunctional 5,10-methylenetetrahydrofolate dehydrogenase/5,10-methenyltetrahydrofolate cyclohydrolase [Bacteroidales bacterium]
MMKIISGSALSKEIRIRLSSDVAQAVKTYSRSPKLSIILVGDQLDSIKYVKNKQKACAETGMDCEIHHLPGRVDQKTIMQLVDQLNKETTTDGILIQLPLPCHLNTEEILLSVDYRKDADGLHTFNAGCLADGISGILPCTPKGILSLLRYGNIAMSGKHAVVLGRSNLVGKPAAQLLLRENATVTICHSFTNDLTQIVKQADILVLAMGNPDVVTPNMLKPGVAIVDVAMNMVEGQLSGDIFQKRYLPQLENIAGAITPVPGGVGPMTITSLLENTFDIYKSQFLS